MRAGGICAEQGELLVERKLQQELVRACIGFCGRDRLLRPKRRVEAAEQQAGKQ
jgi:hypothetical protein